MPTFFNSQEQIMLYGLDIGGTKMELAVFDLDQNRISTKRVSTPTECYESFKNTIKELILETDKEFNIYGSLGVGIPGFINPTTDKVYCANIPCVNGHLLKTDLELLLDRTVKIENDANCFALSEAIGGAGDDNKTVLGIILGTGVGGGIVLNKKLYTGQNNLAGELGHTPLPYHVYQMATDDFPIINCGCGMKGCVDNYLSGRGLEIIYQYCSGEHLPAKELIQRYRRQDDHAERTVHIFMELLASHLGSLVNILDPGVIVIGGGLSNFDEIYEQVPPLMKKYTLSNSSLPEIRKAAFGDSGGVRGAAMLHF